MAERRLIVDHLKFSYEGLFNASELYSVISTWFFEKGWDWHEKINQEQVTPDGKQIRIVLEPWKSSTDYYKLVMHIKLNCTDVKDVDVEHEGKTLRLNQGLVRITFDGYVVSDRKHYWSKKPFLWFLSVLSQKYFFSDHFAKLEDWIKSDVDDLHTKIKNYLNVFKYTYHA
ncbi:hypothetical protein HYU22_03945 [Candidatus Woesearchaeota archaeon]|nr:hypothetical protein [Candidatus Woesearchaeota archaeon]